jgi:hypothetical protein
MLASTTLSPLDYRDNLDGARYHERVHSEPDLATPNATKEKVMENELQYQAKFLFSQLRLVHKVYEDAVASGIKAPVILLLDLKDAKGEELTRRLTGDASVDKRLKKLRGLRFPFLSWGYATALAYEDAMDFVSSKFSVEQGLLPQPTDEEMTIVIVAANGCIATTLPVEKETRVRA